MKMSEESDVTANLVMFFKIIIVLVFVYPLLHYTLLKSGGGEPAPQLANYTDPPVPRAARPREEKSAAGGAAVVSSVPTPRDPAGAVRRPLRPP
jgi:hypothetical protein